MAPPLMKRGFTIQQARMQQHQMQARNDQPYSNRVDPDHSTIWIDVSRESSSGACNAACLR
jgi:hypothetical protein